MTDPVKLDRQLIATASMVLVLALQVSVGARVKVPSPFTDHMVLQREMPVPVWGEADAGEPVTVTFSDQKRSTTTDASGRWQVRLDAMPARAESSTMTIAGKGSTINIENVVVGDVWVCAGDSSLLTPLSESFNVDRELPVANYPLLRVVTPYPALTNRQPAKEFRSGEWVPCFPQTANFAAIAYYFGRDVFRAVDVPIGVIVVSSQSCAETWCSPETADKFPTTKRYADMWRWIDSRYKGIGNDENKLLVTATNSAIELREYRDAFRKWQVASARNRAAGRPVSDEFPIDMMYFPSWRVPTPMSSHERPGAAYNMNIAPLVPYAIKGIVWHHGLANIDSRDPLLYRDAMEACVADWRDRWKQKDLPVLVAQLQSGGKHSPHSPVQDNWSIIREQQWLLSKNVQKVWMTPAYDTTLLAEQDWRVSVNKEPVGRRLAALAAKNVYGKETHAAGPVYESMLVEGSEVHVRLKSARGLIASQRPMPPDAVASATPNAELKGFAIAGEDRKWFWADAKIDGELVVASNEQVKKPVAVRYAWTDFTFGNLADSEALPAAPFRSDDWPLTPERK